MANQVRLLGELELNWIKNVGGGTGIGVFGALFDKVIDTEHVKAAIEELLDRHVLLSALVVEKSKGKLCLETVINHSPSLIIHEKPWPSPDLDGHTGIIFFPHDSHDKQGSLALNRVISDELNTNFLNTDGKTIPPLHVFQVHVYAGPGSRHQTVIVLKLHGGIFDRYSSGIVVQEFLGCLKKAVGAGMNSQTSQVRGDCDVLPCIEDLMPKRLLSKGMFQKGIDAVAYAVNSKRCSLLPFNPSFTSSNKPTFKSEFLTLSLGKQGTASLYAACNQEKASHAATLAAAFLKAAAGVRELKEKKLDEFACSFGTNCRALLEPKVGEGVLGLYSLGFPVFEKVKEGVDFWELARHLDASLNADLRKAKQFSEYAVRNMLFSQVLKHPNMTPNSSLRTVLFELFGGDPLDIQREEFHELGLVGALGPFSSMHFVGPCFAIAETLLEGPELLVSLVYSSPVYCQSQIYQILRSMIDLLYQSCKNF